MKLNVLLLFILVFLLNACKKSIDDSEKPEVITFFVNTSNAIPGGQITLNADISDNNFLKSYKITVIDNFGYTADSIEETIRLSDVFVKEIENQSIHTINNYSLPIPINTSAGPYLLKLSVVDEKGNESTEKISSFEILNSVDQPTINITNPTSSSIFNQGDTIFVAGVIQDDIAVKEINLSFSNTNGVFNTNQFLYDTVVKQIFNISTDGNLKVVIPSLSGKYSLSTSVKDTVGNFKINLTNFIVN